MLNLRKSNSLIKNKGDDHPLYFLFAIYSKIDFYISKSRLSKKDYLFLSVPFHGTNFPLHF